MRNQAPFAEASGKIKKSGLPSVRQSGKRSPEESQAHVLLSTHHSAFKVSCQRLEHPGKVRAARAGLKVLGAVDAPLPAAVKGQKDRQDTPMKTPWRGMADDDPGHAVFLAFA